MIRHVQLTMPEDVLVSMTGNAIPGDCNYKRTSVLPYYRNRDFYKFFCMMIANFRIFKF